MPNNVTAAFLHCDDRSASTVNKSQLQQSVSLAHSDSRTADYASHVTKAKILLSLQ